MSRASHSEKNLPHEGNGGVKFGPDHPSAMDYQEHVESSFNIPGVSIAMPQISGDPECSKSIYKSDPAQPTKAKKLNTDRSDSRKYVDYVHKVLLFLFLYFWRYKLNFSFKFLNEFIILDYILNSLLFNLFLLLLSCLMKYK